MKARVIAHNDFDTTGTMDRTGMVHLDTEVGRANRRARFPVGYYFDAVVAHNYGDVTVYRLYAAGGALDYFSEDEVAVL